MYDDDHDDTSPEDLLHSSAAPLRRDHPMDGWHEITPGAPSTWNPAAPGTSHPPSSGGRVGRPRAPWTEVLGDRWTGWWERRRQARGQGPSERAWQEALEYFAGRYHDRAPDPVAFARLVRRNGTPDWPNPFPQGHPRHYAYHPQGLILMDVSILLEGMTSALNDEPPLIGDAARHRDQVEWVTLEDALQDNVDDARAHALINQRLAMTCWAMLLAWGNGFSRSRQEVHADNLTAITVETLMVFDPIPWGMTLPRMAAGAVQAGLINLPTAQAVLRQRALMDQAPEDQPVAVPLPKAPPLPVDAWLARRHAADAVASVEAPSPVPTPFPPSPSVTPIPAPDFDSTREKLS